MSLTMKQKMIERMKNYAGAPKPLMAYRVPVNMPDRDGDMVPAGYGIFPPDPNHSLRIEKITR